MCNSAGENDKLGQCKMRSVVYETYCITCEDLKSSGGNEGEGCTLEEGKLKKAVKSSDENIEKVFRVVSPGGEKKRVTHTLEESYERSVVKSLEEKGKEKKRKPRVVRKKE